MDLDWISAAVEALVRAAARKLVRDTRQMWLFGARPGDRVYDTYHAAQRLALRSPELTGRRLTLGEAWSGWVEIGRQ